MHFSWGDSREQKASWELPGELLESRPGRVWVLVMVGDEGSTGQALFFWLVGQIRARVMWWRDPSHRLSNVFVRSLNSVLGLREHVCDILVLHKFRRAPYGTGRFLKALKETIALILRKWQYCKQVVEPFREGIAADNGVEPDMDSIKALLEGFCRMALGPRVEMRRWFTFIEMGPALLKIWQILLLALTAQALFEGRDPWAMASEAARTIWVSGSQSNVVASGGQSDLSQ